MTNTDIIRTLSRGASYVHVLGGGMAPQIIRTLDKGGKLRKLTTGAVTLYTLRSRGR